MLHLVLSSMVCPVCRCPGAACLPFVPTDEVLEVFYVVLDEYCFRRTSTGILQLLTSTREPSLLYSFMRVGPMLQNLSIEATTQSFVAVLGLSSAMIMPFALKVGWSLPWTTHALT